MAIDDIFYKNWKREQEENKILREKINLLQQQLNAKPMTWCARLWIEKRDNSRSVHTYMSQGVLIGVEREERCIYLDLW